jgi:hypothetical protein
MAIARPRELETRLLALLDGRLARGPASGGRGAALAGLALLLAMPAAALTPQRRGDPASIPEPEPDRRADSIAAPVSERLRLGTAALHPSPTAAAALVGPDSALARRLLDAVGRVPEHPGDLVSERAQWALSQAREGRLGEPLIAALGHRDWRVQSDAAGALAMAREPRARDPLVALLAHPVWRLRAMAAYALRELADPAAAEAMAAALTDPAWQVRVEAVQYAAAVSGSAPSLTEYLTPRLTDRHVAVRRAAAHALTP